MNRYTIPLPEALQLAARRRAERHAAVQADLDDLKAAGCVITINAAQIIHLEDAGLDYDFDTGFVEDLTTAPDNPRRGLSVEEVTMRLNHDFPDRPKFYPQVATTLAPEPVTLREMTAEMMNGL